MKVLLLVDVDKIGEAGDVVRVFDRYAKNYLLPRGLAVLATPSAIKQAESTRSDARMLGVLINEQLSRVARQIDGLEIGFPSRASPTGRLFRLITRRMIANEISRKIDILIDDKQIKCKPIRNLGKYKCFVQLNYDLIPEVAVIVYREDEELTTLENDQRESVLVYDKEGMPTSKELEEDEVSYPVERWGRLDGSPTVSPPRAERLHGGPTVSPPIPERPSPKPQQKSKKK